MLNKINTRDKVVMATALSNYIGRAAEGVALIVNVPLLQVIIVKDIGGFFHR